MARFLAALNPATSGTVSAARGRPVAVRRAPGPGEISSPRCQSAVRGVVCDAFGVVGVELQSVVDSDDPFGLLAWRQFGRTVQRSGLSGAVMYLTSPFDT